MTQARRERGRRGEEIAEAYLRERRYAILARNWRTRAGEIDLVASRDGVVVFVEVRGREGERFGTPFESIDPRKRARLGRTAAAFLQSRGLEDRVARFDVIGVDWGPAKPVVEHLEGAFDLGD
jgi:putative endonuclease